MNYKTVVGLEIVAGAGIATMAIVAIKRNSDIIKQNEQLRKQIDERILIAEEDEKKLEERKGKVQQELKELSSKVEELVDKKKFICDHEKIILDGASKMRNAIYSKDEKMRGNLLDEGYSLIEDTLSDIRREIEFKKKFPNEIKKYGWLNESRTYIVERVKLSGMTDEDAIAELTLMDREKELLRWMLQA